MSGSFIDYGDVGKDVCVTVSLCAWGNGVSLACRTESSRNLRESDGGNHDSGVSDR